MSYEEKYKEALKRADSLTEKYGGRDFAEYVFPELAESEDERIRKKIIENVRLSGGYTDEEIDEMICWLEKQKEPHYTKRNALFDKCVENCDPEVMKKVSDEVDEMLEKEKQKEQKPIIQDVELNDAVYDYVRDHFIAGANFTPEYIKKLMENAFFAGVDYYLLKQESESCESDTNVEKVIEDVIRVYGKTQGEWVGGYDVDTLIVNLRRAFNKKERKPAEWSEEDKMPMPEDTVIFQKGVAEGRRLEREDNNKALAEMYGYEGGTESPLVKITFTIPKEQVKNLMPIKQGDIFEIENLTNKEGRR